MIGHVHDEDERAELLRPMMEYAEKVNHGKEMPHTLRSIIARMQSAKDQFTGLVSALYHLEVAYLLFGVVGSIVS